MDVSNWWKPHFKSVISKFQKDINIRYSHLNSEDPLLIHFWLLEE